MTQYSSRQTKLVVAGLTTLSGQKVHNLLAATRQLGPQVEILTFVDADVRPPRDWLRVLTQRLNHFVAATGYRWCVPKRPTLANCIVASIDSSIVPIMFPSFHHKVWGGSWAIRRDVFEASGMAEAWQGTLSDDLVAANVLATLRHSVSLEPACILPTPIDMTMRSMFAFVRRQFMIGRYYSLVSLDVSRSFGNCSDACIVSGEVSAARRLGRLDRRGLDLAAGDRWNHASMCSTSPAPGCGSAPRGTISRSYRVSWRLSGALTSCWDR